MFLEKAAKIYAGNSEELHKIIISLYNMAQISKREGILALDDLQNEAFANVQCEEIRSFGRQMLEFILDGVGSCELAEIAQGFIAQSELGDEELLCLMVLAEGLLKLQEGQSGSFLIKKLIFALGYKNQKAIYDKVLLDFQENFSLATFCETNLDSAQEKKTEVSRDELGLEELMKLSDVELCNLLDSFSIEEWALAMKTADNCVQSRIFTLLSKIQASTMKNLMEYSGPVKLKDIEHVQRQIKEKMKQGKNEGK